MTIFDLMTENPRKLGVSSALQAFVRWVWANDFHKLEPKPKLSDLMLAFNSKFSDELGEIVTMREIKTLKQTRA